MLKKNRLFVSIILFTVTVVLGLHNWQPAQPAPVFHDDAELQSLIGMDEDQVRATLGEPGAVVHGPDGKMIWQYQAPMRDPQGKQSSGLYVEFDANGRVYKISNHI
jgi:hypothetical protein